MGKSQQLYITNKLTLKAKNIKRNPNRMRKTARRTATNWIDAMTPQGQAIYCAEFVENAAGFNPELELIE